MIQTRYNFLFILITVIFGCCENRQIKSQSECPEMTKDSITVFIGRYFVNDIVTIRINDFEYFKGQVTTDRSIEVATSKTFPSDSIRRLTFIVNDEDSILLCPAPFLIINFIDGKIESESLDSIPKLKFL